MVDKPARPILHLKFTPSSEEGEAMPAPVRVPLTLKPSANVFIPPKPTRPRPMMRARPAPPPPPPKPTFEWKCKPCGQGLSVPMELADDEYVRCPSCNARLGLAGDFRSDPPGKVRARAV
jgi:DNA-directed RNA polymerase subunit RPC12/RpoP